MMDGSVGQRRSGRLFSRVHIANLKAHPLGFASEEEAATSAADDVAVRAKFSSSATSAPRTKT